METLVLWLWAPFVLLVVVGMAFIVTHKDNDNRNREPDLFEARPRTMANSEGLHSPAKRG